MTTIDPTTAAAPERADFADLAVRLTGTVHAPGSAEYTALATPWNVAVASRPAAVVRVADAADVSTTMRFAAARGLQVSVQATGHGACERPVPTLQINTRDLRELSISPIGSMRAGAGLTWNDVLAAAAPLGFTGIVGSAPGVGITGFLTGGGVGPLARTYGLASDYVTAFDVVTGDGHLRRASATEHPELFWALRGGKDAVGIVTAIEFDLVPLTELLGGCLYFAGADAAAVVHAWRTWTETLPEQATTSLAVLRLPPAPGVPAPLAGQVTVAVRYAWIGDPEVGRALFAPIADAAPVVLGGIGVMPSAAIGMIHNDPVEPMPSFDASTLLRELPVDAADAFLELVGPDAQCPQVIAEIRHVGGAMRRPRSGPSAFDHREAGYAVSTIGIGVPPAVAATQAHAAAVQQRMAAWSDGACWPNFQATTDPAELARKYAPDTLQRLAVIATTHDPDGVLAGAVPVRRAAWAS